MDQGRDTGVIEAAWRRWFGTFAQRGLPKPRLHILPGDLPVLAVPAGLDAEDREDSYAAAIVKLFVELYGAEALAACIGEWPRIVAAVGADQEFAAD